jgi:hypothetical protein
MPGADNPELGEAEERQMNTETINRKWQNHIKAKGIIPLYLGRLQ